MSAARLDDRQRWLLLRGTLQGFVTWQLPFGGKGSVLDRVPGLFAPTEFQLFTADSYVSLERD
jgi:hypothetical protein